MLGKNHLLLGAAASTTTLLAAGISPVRQTTLFASGLLIGSIAALLPDIDSPDAKIRSSVGLGSHQSRRNLKRRNQDVVEKVLNMTRFVVARLLDIVTGLLPHRGITHWGITWLGVALISQVVVTSQGWNPLLGWLFTLGYGSHLLADSLTRAGIPLLAPVRRRKFRLLPKPLALRTGSGQEQIAVTVLVALMMGWLVVQPALTPLLADGPFGLFLSDLLF